MSTCFALFQFKFGNQTFFRGRKEEILDLNSSNVHKHDITVSSRPKCWKNLFLKFRTQLNSSCLCSRNVGMKSNIKLKPNLSEAFTQISVSQMTETIFKFGPCSIHQHGGGEVYDPFLYCRQPPGGDQWLLTINNQLLNYILCNSAFHTSHKRY